MNKYASFTQERNVRERVIEKVKEAGSRIGKVVYLLIRNSKIERQGRGVLLRRPTT